MKQLLFVLIGLIGFALANAQPSDTLTNDVIIKLQKAGFGKDILKSKIENSNKNFDMSIDGMVALKKAGVPEDIINLMLSNPKTASSGTTNTVISEENQGLKGFNLGSGIYYKNPPGEYIEIEPSVLTNTKSNNAAQIFLSPLLNSKVKASLSDKQSSMTINESVPKILFVFDTSYKSSLSNDNNSWFANVRSPKEFLLVKLEVVKNSREITVGKGNIVSSNYGIDDNSIIHFTSTKLSKGVYEISPESALLPGEYALMFAQGVKQGASSKVFDFSIRSQKGF